MMTHEEFEQLLSESLDDPQRVELRARVDQAAGESSEFAGLRTHWLRLHEVLATEPAFLNGVNWLAFQARIRALIALEAEADAQVMTRLTVELRSATELPAEFDVGRKSLRLKPSPTTRRRIWSIAGLVTAAAAAVALVVRWPSAPPIGSAVVAIVVPQSDSGGGVQFARMAVREQTDDAAQAERQQYELSRAPHAAELFLMIAPAPDGEREVSNIDPVVLN